MILRSAWLRIKQASSFPGHVALTMVGNLFLMGIALVTGSLAARLLGSEGRGELAAIQNWALLLSALGSLGLPQAITYFTGREPERSGRILGTAMLALLVLSLPIISFGYFLMPWVLQAQSWEIVREARLYLLLIPVNSLAVTFYTLQGRNDFATWNLLRPIAPLLWLGILLLAFATGQQTPAFVARSYLMGLALLILTLDYWLITRRISGPYEPEVELANRMVRFGIPCMLTTTPQLLNLRLDQLVMAALLPAHMLGLYVVAVAWSSLLAPCLNAVATVIFPRLASTHDTIQQVSTLGRILRLTILLAGGLVVGLLALTPIALPIIFGREFVSAIPAALLLVVASAIANLSVVIEEGLRGLGAPRWPMIAECIGLVFTVVLLSLLLRPYQIMGAAAASLVSCSVILCVLVMGVVRTTGMSLKESLVPGRKELGTIYRGISGLLARPAEGDT